MIKPRKALNLSGESPVESSIPNSSATTPSLPSNSIQPLANVGERGNEGRAYSALLSITPNSAWPPWCMDYLQALTDPEVLSEWQATQVIDRHPTTVWSALQVHKDFAQAVERIKRYRDWLILGKLEEGTLQRAIKQDPTDRQSATLAIVHLKARDHRYRDQGQAQGQGHITINFGAVIGGQQPQKMTIDLASGQEVTEADYEDVTPKLK